MPISLILMNQSLTGNLVNLRHGFTVALGGLFGIALTQGPDDFFHGSAHAGFECHIVQPSALGLSGTLGC